MRLVRAAVVAVILLMAAHAAAQEAATAKGKYLVFAGGCIDCHTADRDRAIPLAGGRALKSPFGTFYPPNITPDVDTGIGAWSDDDFLKAFWEGIGPDGDHYYPAFPYTSYTGISREDLLAIKAYLFSLAPVRQDTPEHDLAWYASSRLAVRAWQRRYFRSARFVPDSGRPQQWNRGAYLVRHLGHCGECHTPRNSVGAVKNDRELAGNRDGPDDREVPNISPDRNDGIGKWSVSDIEYFLDTGMYPDGDFVGGAMSDVIDNCTSKLTKADRLAIATYLKSIPPQPESD